MNYILFDDSTRANLLPLTYVRPVCDLLFGIVTIREKWQRLLHAPTSTLTETYLSTLHPLVKAEQNILINGSICPTVELVEAISSLKVNQVLVKEDLIIAMFLSADQVEGFGEDTETDAVEFVGDFIKINNLWDLFSKNDEAIRADFEMLTKGRVSAKLSSTNRIIGEENLFVEEGVEAEFATINAKEGPVYIGKNACIMENASIRGPLALCEGASLKMGAKIYGPTTIGPYSKVGGEMNTTLMFAYSNKAHDGFVGHSVIGEWCNFGADTNVSNLKNTYDEVKLWSIPNKKFIGTSLNFCGMIMGDHSRCGINTMFNTGTVVGISSNIFGHGYQRNFISSFVWGGNHGFKPFDFEKAIEVAERMMERRGVKMTAEYRAILVEVFNQTKPFKYIK